MPAGAIDALVGRLRQTPDAAVAGPRLVDGDGRAELSFGRMISPLNELRQQRVMRALARGDAAALRKVEALTRRGQWPDWVSGACLLVRREDAEAVGLLDERFFMYTEDVDFCAAIRARGRRVLFTPDVRDRPPARPVGRHGARGDARGVPTQPPGVLPRSTTRSSRGRCGCTTAFGEQALCRAGS